MRELSGLQRSSESETERAIVEQAEQVFEIPPPVLPTIARTLWKSKTAAHLAAASNCSVRAAEMYLAGDREWSGDAIAALVSEILKRHAMRNVKVVARPK